MYLNIYQLDMAGTLQSYCHQPMLSSTLLHMECKYYTQRLLYMIQSCMSCRKLALNLL